MGYTHNWTRPEGSFAESAWEAFCRDARTLLAHPEIAPLVTGAEITADFVRFDGSDPDPYETLFIGRSAQRQSYDKPGECFACCKTAQRPYDLAVCCTLLLAARHLPGIRVTSDGDWDAPQEWADVPALFARVFRGYGEPPCPWPTEFCPECGQRFARDGHNWWMRGEPRPCGEWHAGALCHHCGRVSSPEYMRRLEA